MSILHQETRQGFKSSARKPVKKPIETGKPQPEIANPGCPDALLPLMLNRRWMLQGLHHHAILLGLGL